MSGAHVGHSTSGTPKLRGDWGIVVGWPWTPLSISATGMNFKMTIPLASCTMPDGQKTEEKVAGPTPLDLPTWSLDIYLIALSSLGPGSGE